MNDEYTSAPAPVTASPPPAAAAAAALPARPMTALLARVGLLGIAAAAIVAAAILAFGATASPTGTLAAGTTDGTSGWTETLNLGGGPGRGGFGPGKGGITITAISGSNISLETVDGWTRTITVDSGTEYSKSGDEIALGDLAVGDEIAFRQTLEDDGTWTIDAIVVIPPHAGGEVTAVSGSTITVEQRDGTTATITVNADTEYQVNGDDATLADIEVGMFLVAQGSENASGDLTATEVKAADPDSFGRPGRHGFKFGPGFDRDGADDDADATAAPSSDTSAT
jgi:hypothetical protein